MDQQMITKLMTYSITRTYMVEGETCRLYSDLPTHTMAPMTHIHPCTGTQRQIAFFFLFLFLI